MLNLRVERLTFYGLKAHTSSFLISSALLLHDSKYSWVVTSLIYQGAPASIMYLQRTFRWRDSAFPKSEVHHSRLQEQHHTKSQWLVQGPTTNGHTWVLNPGPLPLSPVSLHHSTFPYLTSPLRCLLALNPCNRSKSKTPWKAPRFLSLKVGWPDIMCFCYDAIWGQSTPVKCSCQKGWSHSNQPVRTHIHFKEIRGERQNLKVITEKKSDTSKGEAPYRTMDAVAPGGWKKKKGRELA